MQFEIKHRFNGSVLFSGEFGSLKLCVEAAVRSRANLADADLSGSYFARAYLVGVNLARAYLVGVNLAGANLARADLARAYLAGANLARADLARAYLVGANLVGANLARANLVGANLVGANLRHANFAHADCTGAKGINAWRTDAIRMLLDQPGQAAAYKLVTARGIGPFNGGIEYRVGETAKADACDTDERVQCGAGISLATLPWCAQNWTEGYRILIAEFDPKTAVIPLGTDGKFRVPECRIVGEKDLADIGLMEKAVTG